MDQKRNNYKMMSEYKIIIICCSPSAFTDDYCLYTHFNKIIKPHVGKNNYVCEYDRSKSHIRFEKENVYKNSILIQSSCSKIF